MGFDRQLRQQRMPQRAMNQGNQWPDLFRSLLSPAFLLLSQIGPIMHYSPKDRPSKIIHLLSGMTDFQTSELLPEALKTSTAPEMGDAPGGRTQHAAPGDKPQWSPQPIRDQERANGRHNICQCLRFAHRTSAGSSHPEPGEAPGGIDPRIPKQACLMHKSTRLSQVCF